MSINFTRLFQDGWNFIRNRPQFAFTFTATFFLCSLIMNLLSDSMIEAVPVLKSDMQGMTNEELVNVILQRVDMKSFVLFYILNQILFLFVSSWGILTVHHISLGNNHLFNTLMPTLNRFLGVLILNLLIVFPLFITAGSILAANMTGSSSSVFSLFIMFFAIFIFIRLCLAPVCYLVKEKDLPNSILFIWQKGNNQTLNLFLYCLLVYFILQLVVQKLTLFADNMFMATIVILFISFLNTLSLVITYRFYNLFVKKA